MPLRRISSFIGAYLEMGDNRKVDGNNSFEFN